MTITDRLAEIQARADAVQIRDDLLPTVMAYVAGEGLSAQGAIQAGLRMGAEAALSDVPRLVAALRAVLDLHSRDYFGECAACPPSVAAPCPTVKAASAALSDN